MRSVQPRRASCPAGLPSSAQHSRRGGQRLRHPEVLGGASEPLGANREQQVLATNLIRYYQTNGSWNGMGDLLQELQDTQAISRGRRSSTRMTKTPSITPERGVRPPLVTLTSVGPMVPAPGWRWQVGCWMRWAGAAGDRW